MSISTAITVTNDAAVIDEMGVAGAGQSSAVTHLRPKPRAQKEKLYRDAVRNRQLQTPLRIEEWAVKIAEMLRSRDAEARNQNDRDIATFFQYYDCNEYGEFDESGQWIPDAQADKENDISYSVPLVPAHVDAAKTLLLKTALEYEYKPTHKLNTLDRQVAKMCQELAEEEMERIFTDDMKIDEALYLLLAGKSFRNHYWARDPLEPATVEVPVYSHETTEGQSSRQCGNPDCGAVLKPDDELCPRCMGNQINETAGGEIKKITSTTEQVTLGRNQMYVPNPLLIQTDLSKRNINTGFLIERDALLRAEAEYLYSQVLPTNRSKISESVKMVRNLERAKLRTGNVVGDEFETALNSLFGDAHDLIERERMWLPKWMYANVVVSEKGWYVTKQDGLVWCDDEQNVPENAKPVEPGSFMGDLFPTGCFLCLGDDNVLEINGSGIADVWVKLIFGKRPANADGAGLRRLRHLADMGNDATNLEFQVLMNDANPMTFLLRSALSHLVEVGKYALIDNVPEGKTPKDVVYREPGASAHPALGIANEKVQGYAQFLAGTFSSMGPGAPDARASGTATGIVKMAEEAAGRYLEAVLCKKTADIESRFKVLNNIRRNSIEPQKQDLIKRFGPEVVERFFSCRLRELLQITVKKGTDQPQSQAIRIAQLEAFTNASAQVGQLPDGASMIGELAELIDLPVTVGAGQTDREEAERRIGLIQERGEKFNDQQLQPDQVAEMAIALFASVMAACEQEIATEQPEQLAPTEGHQIPQNQDSPPDQGDEGPASLAPTVIMMQEHPVFMDACKDWLLTEGARGRNQVTRASVQLMWKLHYGREIEKQKELARIQALIALEPEKIKQEFMASIAPPVEEGPTPEELAEQERAAADQAAEQDGERAVIQGVVDRIADEDAKDAEFERQEAAKDADLEREAMKQELAGEIAKENQAAKPQPTAGTK